MVGIRWWLFGVFPPRRASPAVSLRSPAPPSLCERGSFPSPSPSPLGSCFRRNDGGDTGMMGWLEWVFGLVG